MTAPTSKPANFCSLSGVSPMAIASPLATLPPAVAVMVTLPSMVIAALAFFCPLVTLPLPMAAPPEIASSSDSPFGTVSAAPPFAVMLGEPASVLLMETLFLVSSVSGSVSAPPPMPAAPPLPPCAFSIVALPLMVTSPRPPAPPPMPAPPSPPVASLISALPLMVTLPSPLKPPPMPAPKLRPCALSIVTFLPSVALPSMFTVPSPYAPPPMPAPPLLPPVVLSMVGLPSINTFVLP